MYVSRSSIFPLFIAKTMYLFLKYFSNSLMKYLLISFLSPSFSVKQLERANPLQLDPNKLPYSSSKAQKLMFLLRKYFSVRLLQSQNIILAVLLAILGNMFFSLSIFLFLIFFSGFSIFFDLFSFDYTYSLSSLLSSTSQSLQTVYTKVGDSWTSFSMGVSFSTKQVEGEFQNIVMTSKIYSENCFFVWDAVGQGCGGDIGQLQDSQKKIQQSTFSESWKELRLVKAVLVIGWSIGQRPSFSRICLPAINKIIVAEISYTFYKLIPKKSINDLN